MEIKGETVISNVVFSNRIKTFEIDLLKIEDDGFTIISCKDKSDYSDLDDLVDKIKECKDFKT